MSLHVQSEPCKHCGFYAGELVQMLSGLTKLDGSPYGEVYGTVENWPEGGCHIVQWAATGTVTGLPNPNVSIGVRVF